MWLSEIVECHELEEEYSRDMNPILDSLSVPPPPLMDLDNDAIEKAPPKVHVKMYRSMFI